MDAILEVTPPRRAVTVDLDTDVPLVAVVWRLLHAIHEEQAGDRQQRERQQRRLNGLFTAVADEVVALRRLGDRAAAAANRLEQALLEVNVDIVAPEGAAYDGPLVELVENTAQQPRADLTEPLVAEVIQPAVLRHGELLRMGKAVIAVPGKQ
jgi:hypothetical protein